MSSRTFLALDIDETTRAALSRAVGRVLGAGDVKARCVSPANMHVTLNFLGDVDDARLAQVCDAVAAAATAAEPFEFAIRELICVPNRGPLRMIWAGAEEPTGRLASLQQRLTAAMEELGFAPERRPFNAHITLARIRYAKEPDRLRALAGRQKQDFGLERAEEVVTYTSVLAPGGPEYTVAARAKLG